jgi:hypothetical protein
VGYIILADPSAPGLFAIFSTHTETIVIWNAPENAVIEWFAQKAAKDAREAIERDLSYIKAGEPEHVYGRPAMTWEQALRQDGRRGGQVSKELAEAAERSVD